MLATVRAKKSALVIIPTCRRDTAEMNNHDMREIDRKRITWHGEGVGALIRWEGGGGVAWEEVTRDKMEVHWAADSLYGNGTLYRKGEGWEILPLFRVWVREFLFFFTDADRWDLIETLPLDPCVYKHTHKLDPMVTVSKQPHLTSVCPCLPECWHKKDWHCCLPSK